MSRSKRDRCSADFETIPAHVRRFHLIQKIARHSAGKTPSRERGSFFACLQHPLHAKANARATASGSCIAHSHSRTPGSPSLRASRGREMPTPGKINFSACITLIGSLVTTAFGVRGDRIRLHHRSQIARSVINDGDHNSPFVLGSMRPIWRSLPAGDPQGPRERFEQGFNLVMIRSTVQYLRTCTLAFAPRAKPSKKSGDQFRLQISHQPRAHLCIDHCGGASPKNRRDASPSVSSIGITKYPARKMPRLLPSACAKACPRRDSYVLDSVVLIDVEVAFRYQSQIEGSMARQ